jgi:hypothetical protein
MTQFSLALIRLAFAATLSLTVHQKAIGAEITQISEVNTITIEGPIEPGDCIKIVDLLHKVGTHQIFLASAGGNLTEAMVIGRLVRTLKLDTIVPGYVNSNISRNVASRYHVMDFDHNFMCTSACFFIFIAGVERSEKGFRSPALRHP